MTRHLHSSSFPAPPGSSEALRRRIASAGTVRHPGLVEIVSIEASSGGVEVAYAVPDGARHLSGEEQPDADGVLRLMAPVAAGLALVHDAGFAHGGVARDRLWARADGAGVLGPGPGAGEPADDVRDLGAVLESLLPGRSVGADIAHLLVIAADPDPSLRPSMARMAAVLDGARRRAASDPLAALPRRSGPPTSPSAHRRSTVATAASPLAAPDGERQRARHAARHAPAGRSLPSFPGIDLAALARRWRTVVTVLGLVLVAFIGLHAMRGASATERCSVSAETISAPTLPTLPAGSPSRSRDRSR